MQVRISFAGGRFRFFVGSGRPASTGYPNCKCPSSGRRFPGGWLGDTRYHAIEYGVMRPLTPEELRTNPPGKLLPDDFENWSDEKLRRLPVCS